MASADIAVAVEAPPPPMDDSPLSSPHSSVVYSIASTSALTLDGLSRQNSAVTIHGLDDSPSDEKPRPATPFHRVSSEQALPTTSRELTASALNAARATSMVVGKVTSRRRQRNPRRFVVTELPPEHDEFANEATTPATGAPALSPLPPPAHQASTTTVAPATRDHANGGGANATSDTTTTKAYRPSKMEVRGRFTIIDLSPDAAEASTRLNESSAIPDPTDAPPRPTTRASANGSAHGAVSRMRRAMPARRYSRGEKASSMTMAMASAPPALPESAVLTAAMLRQDESHHGHGYYGHGSHNYAAFSPKTPLLSPHGVDLNALDRHLVFLQQESLDMKAVLESMISSNARWISALSSSSGAENVGSGKNPKAVHPTTTPQSPPPVVLAPPPPPAVVVVPHEPTLEEKYEKLLAAHQELQQKHEHVTSEAAQLKRTNLLLETRLRQETSVNEELRAHVDQLTQYTESLIYSAGEPPPRRKESLSSSSTEVAVENGVHTKASPEVETETEQDAPVSTSKAPRSKQPTKSLGRRHERTISEVSVDSAATWTLETENQFPMDDDDDSNIDSDDVDPRNARAVKAMRRRRWRVASRSTSMSMEDDSASSVYSSSYRDSWVSLFDPVQSSSTSDWRALSYDGADSSVDDLLFDGATTKPRHNSSEMGSLVVVETASSNNQTEDEAAHELAADAEQYNSTRRRKSSVMIVEELEDEHPEAAEAEVPIDPAQ